MYSVYVNGVLWATVVEAEVAWALLKDNPGSITLVRDMPVNAEELN